MLSDILDLIFPSSLYCICCGNAIDETRTYNLCDHCIAHIKWDGEDIKRVMGLDMLRCTEYGIYERTMIFSLKYNNKRYIARDIGQIMADRLELAEYDFDIIIPVPLHRKKEKLRGFNQAGLIGKYMARATGRVCIEDALIRAHYTRPMRGLSQTERAENIRNQFAINEKYVKMLQGKRIVLVDDFYTTGATARECASVLSSCNPESILFLAFAAKV